jgi:hypothetical protein
MNAGAIGILALALACSGAPATAQGQGQAGRNAATGKQGPPSAAAQAVEDARTAYALARYGDANQDALALITAARLLKELGGSDSSARWVSPAGSKAGGGRPMTLQAILERAKALAAGRADLLALVADVESSGTRGRTDQHTGPYRTVVNARATDVFTITFRGAETAVVAISGDGESDLDLYIRDENGHLVCYSESDGDDEWCRWTPRWTGPFTIRVVNRGDVANQYILRRN